MEDRIERIKRFGYTSRGYSYYVTGENTAAGSGSYGEPDHAMHFWMHSEGHRSNILNGKFRQVGVGAFTGNYEGTDNFTTYTVNFGGRR